MRRLRFLVACLLLLALPLQGLAAAANLFCGPAAAQSHAHDEGDGATGHHDSHDHAASDAAPGAADATCSACASCCHGAVASGTATVPAFSVPSSWTATPSPVAPRMRVTPPPDKPPRA